MQLKYKVLMETKINAIVNAEVKTNRANRRNKTYSINIINYKVDQDQHVTVYLSV